VKLLLKAVGTLFILGLLFVFGYAFRDIQRGRMPSGETLKGIVGRVEPSKTSPARVFRDAYSHIQTNFAKDVDRNRLKYSGMAGLMASLGDPHTMFMEPKSASAFQLETKAKFAGVGARLAPDPLGSRVAVVFDEGPAASAGLKVGDIITRVNDKPVGGKNVDEIVDQVRGPEGTSVELTIVREGNPNPIHLKIRRAQIVVPTVTSNTLPNTPYGYIALSTFSEPTSEQFERAVDKLNAAGIRGLVIDLRGNPGGLLDTAIEILSLFVENKPVVSMKGRDGKSAHEITYSGLKRPWNYPVVTLVNEESASAAEIMAGVLKEYGLTTLVGEHTYGKASVQNMFAMKDGSSAKVTIARYYLPSGADISRKVDEDGVYISGGIPVDVEVKLQDEPTPVLGDPKGDSQLRKAIEVLDSKRKSSTVKRFNPVVAEELGLVLTGSERVA
jgi:carboxyl-terminal processing protease